MKSLRRRRRVLSALSLFLLSMLTSTMLVPFASAQGGGVTWTRGAAGTDELDSQGGSLQQSAGGATGTDPDPTSGSPATGGGSSGGGTSSGGGSQGGGGGPTSGPPAGAGISAQAISLPGGEGSIEGMGESFAPILSSGTATFEVPVVVTPGRAGVQPSLAFRYASTSGNGSLGIGWGLGVPFIARQTDRGLPSYLDEAAWHPEEDRFIYNGGQELVPVDNASTATVDAGAWGYPTDTVPTEVVGWQQYRAKVEGAFMRFFRSPDSTRWVVQSKDGTRFDFGLLADGADGLDDRGAVETESDSGAGKIFQWHLTRTSDAHGSTIYYQYFADAGQRYLESIHYISPASCAAGGDADVQRKCGAPLSEYGAKVSFDYELRADVTSDYIRGWRAERRLRLARVTVTAAEDSVGTRYLVRRYHLSYDPSSYYSLLSSLQLEGRPSHLDPTTDARVFDLIEERSLGAAIIGDSLPPMEFAYSTQPFESTQAPGVGGVSMSIREVRGSPGRTFDPGQAEMFDVNSDGLSDFVVTDPARYRTREGDPAVGVFFNGFEGKDARPAGEAAVFSDAVPVAVAPGLSNILQWRNDQVVPMDVDGDGRGDFLHMVRRNEYGWFTPTRNPDGALAATSPADQGWRFSYARVELPSFDSDPRIDFVADPTHYKAFDVNNDHLIDVVQTTGTTMRTWLNLGWVAGGEGRFGQASWTGANWSLSTEPIESCLLSDGLPVDFSDPEVRIADMNGDGLQDIVRLRRGSIVYWPGRGTGSWGDGPADCDRGEGDGRHIPMDTPPAELDFNLTGVSLSDVNADGAADIVQVRFGEADVWFNLSGTSFSERVVTMIPTSASFDQDVRFADIDGSATLDLVVARSGGWQYLDFMGGQRPRLLTNVLNGLGAETTLFYDSSTTDYVADLVEAGQCSGTGCDRFTWSQVEGDCDALLQESSGECAYRSGGSPVVSTVVRGSETTDHFEALGREPNTMRSEYAYHDGYYEGIEQEFRGFGAADARAVGDADAPTGWTRSWFHQGRRPNDIATDRLANNPLEATKGRVWMSEQFDEAGRYLSTSHVSYTVRELQEGLDGRAISFAFDSQADTLLYDVADFNPGSELLELPWLTFEQVDPSTGAAGAGDTIEHSISARGERFAQTRATNGGVDNVGNVIAPTAQGRVREEQDAVETALYPDDIERIVLAKLISDQGQWIWRTDFSLTIWASGSLGYTTHSYDSVGDLLLTTTQAIAGFGFDFSGDANGAESFNQVSQQLESSTAYDSFGNPTVQCAGADINTDSAVDCLRYSDVEHDSEYGQLAVTQGVAVGTSSEPHCTMANGLCRHETQATWDRGLGLVESVTDPNNQTADAGYDGLGRPTFIRPPVPGRCAAKTGQPMRRLSYDVAANGLPVSVVTSFEDGGGPGCAGDSLIETRAYFDGLGRPRASALKTEIAGNWEQAGVSTFNARGGSRLTYDNRFLAGEPDPSRAVGLDVRTPAVFVRYDAFGRPVLTRERDGAETRVVYHGLSTDTWDPLDNDPSSIFAGTYTTTRVDGHGRTIDQVQRQRRPATGAMEYHRLITRYRPDNAVTSITRMESGSDAPWFPIDPIPAINGHQVIRSFTYDSAGRRIASVDPDTQSSGGTVRDRWRYLYNEVGDLVAVRDPRGCGVNSYYDRAGRLIGEDYVECGEALGSGQLSNDQVPAGSIALGPTSLPQTVDTRYYFDSDPPWAGSVSAGASPPGSRFLVGRASGVGSRGERSLVGYDERGQPVWSARQMAFLPAAPNVAGMLPDPPVVVDWETINAVTRAYDSETYETTSEYDYLGRSVGVQLPYDPDWYVFGGTGPGPPTVRGQLAFNARGLPSSSEILINGVPTSVIRSITYDEHQLPVHMAMGPAGVGGNPEQLISYDRRLRPVRSKVTRAAVAGTPPELDAVTTVCDDHLAWDAASNLIQTIDGRKPSEWPAGHRPVRRVISHDALYRVANVAHLYRDTTNAWGPVDTGTDWRDERSRINLDGDSHESADPGRRRPAPMVSTQPGDRVVDLTYDHDWLANMVEWSDDASAFYERSIGVIHNGADEPGKRPSALYFATDIRPSPGTYAAGVDQGGYLSVDYGVGGNVEGFTVRAQCADLGPSNVCDDPDGPLASRRSHLDANCVCQSEQHYQYRYDELNRLLEARRYDRPGSGNWSLEVRQRYQYDGGNVRTHKITFADADAEQNEPAERVALYVYPGDFERRGLAPDYANSEYDASVELGTESQYLISGARLVWKNATPHTGLLTREQRLTYTVKNLIQSTSAVVDLRSGVLLEHTTFYPNGARETHRTTDAASLQLEPMGFTGKEADEEVGLVYFGERYLIPRLGRWSTPDPLHIQAVAGGAALNSKHYVAGILLQARDPLGLDPGAPARARRTRKNPELVQSSFTAIDAPPAIQGAVGSGAIGQDLKGAQWGVVRTASDSERYSAQELWVKPTGGSWRQFDKRELDFGDARGGQVGPVDFALGVRAVFKLGTAAGRAGLTKLAARRASTRASRAAMSLVDDAGFQFNMVTNPGPLAKNGGGPALEFAGGRYNAIELTEDLVLYRGGAAGGGRNAFGQWFTREAPASRAHVRIDSAVKPDWIDPATGVSRGHSAVEAAYGIRIPKGTTIYEGPVGYQGGVHLGGGSQVFVPKPWAIEGAKVVSETPLR